MSQQIGGYPPRTATGSPAGQPTTISTGWTNTCRTVTFLSSNGWDTNFDDFRIR